MKLKILLFQMIAISLLVIGCSPAFAAEAAAMPIGTPTWFLSIAGVLGSVVAIVAQLDAQIPEAFKNRCPWWLVVLWDLLAGNYRHSANKDAR